MYTGGMYFSQLWLLKLLDFTWFSLIMPKLCRIGAIVPLRQGRNLRPRDIQISAQLLSRVSPLQAADAGMDLGPAVSRDGDLDQSKPTSLTSQDPVGGVLRSRHLGLLTVLLRCVSSVTQSHDEYLSLCICRAVQVLRTENSVGKRAVVLEGSLPGCVCAHWFAA